MGDGGFIKIHRSINQWEWHDDPITLSVWVHLLIDVNYEDKAWHGTIIKRGQLVIGQRKYAKRCGITQQQLRTVLNRLKSTHEITLTSTNKYTVVTIANYDLYQSINCESTRKSTRKLTYEQHSNNIQSTTTKEVKKERSKEVIVCDTQRPSLAEVIEYCKERNNQVNAEKWFNYYSSNGWKVGRNSMKDWKAAVRTWEEPKKDESKKSRYPLFETEDKR